MENLVSIGQFARASRLSQKALRLYAANGLLPPAWTDPRSGYRYYRVEQLWTARLIGLLRAAGMPLGEIGSFLARPAPETLDAFAERLCRELAGRLEVLSYVRQVMKEEQMFEVQTKTMAAQRYRSRRECVAIEELEPFIERTVEELGPARGGQAFTVYHGAVNEHEDGPVEVCVPREDGDGELPAVEVAYTVAAGKQCDFPAILGAYDAVARWAQESGRALAGPPRELYLSGPGEEPSMEIAWPLR